MCQKQRQPAQPMAHLRSESKKSRTTKMSSLMRTEQTVELDSKFSGLADDAGLMTVAGFGSLLSGRGWTGDWGFSMKGLQARAHKSKLTHASINGTHVVQIAVYDQTVKKKLEHILALHLLSHKWIAHARRALGTHYFP